MEDRRSSGCLEVSYSGFGKRGHTLEFGCYEDARVDTSICLLPV